MNICTEFLAQSLDLSKQAKVGKKMFGDWYMLRTRSSHIP